MERMAMMENKPKPFFITLLRHGESVGNAESRWQGQADFPLTEKGRAQAYALAERWKKEEVTFDHVIASPLTRTKETAEIIASALNLKVEFDPRHLGRRRGTLQRCRVAVAGWGAGVASTPRVVERVERDETH